MCLKSKLLVLFSTNFAVSNTNALTELPFIYQPMYQTLLTLIPYVESRLSVYTVLSELDNSDCYRRF